ncbi:MAG: anthranilate phosphoribosyltransferase [Proteobacteria bacterium]|nr:anthranilate phosphoribosyltransferase [Pseudomonadota bacterium]
MAEMFDYLAKVAAKQHLTEDESARAFQIIMNGGATPAQISALLMAMKINGETVPEILGAVRAIRAKASKINVPEEVRTRMIDTCGTGGDGQHTYNISTAVAFIVAGAGVPVAKHGGKSVSSRSGSSDVLTALGVNIHAAPEEMLAALTQKNIAFLFASNYHAAMRHVGPVRQEMGMRTLFNILGPLTNPAGASRQLIGVYDKQWLKPIAEVLAKLGTTQAWIVHGEDGLDEITTTGKTYVVELKEGAIKEFMLDPTVYGIELAKPHDLKGGDAGVNAIAIRQLLGGKTGAYRDIVLLNAAAAFVVAGVAKDIPEGLAKAKDSLDEKKALRALDALVEMTNRG